MLQPAHPFSEELLLPGEILTFKSRLRTRQLKLSSYRLLKGQPVLLFQSVESIAAAQELLNCELFAPGRAADDFAGDDYLGYQVHDRDGKLLGMVSAVSGHSGHPLLEISDQDGNEILVPLVPEIVTGVDHEQRRLRLDAPEGLLTLNQ